jgi:HAD superfamily hydrolase (TIGR01459 family)
MSPQMLDSFATIAARYDAFVLDLWGVVHDGVAMYPQAGECLAQLKAAGKRVVFLSNAPRRARAVQAVLQRLGVPDDQYEAIYSSGEVAHGWLANGGLAELGNACVFVGLEQDRPMMDGLPLREVTDVEAANFVFCTGYDALFQDPAELEPRLSQWAAAKLPMLCINPDITVVRQDGSTIYCAGHLATRYAALGGRVQWVGKPHARVYDAVRAHFSGIAPERMLCVGDSLHTDIAGANAAGLDSALITGGIHARELAAGETLNVLMTRDHATPSYVLPGFAW